MEQNVCLRNKIKAALKKAAGDLWRQKYQDSVANREASAKRVRRGCQDYVPGRNPTATVDRECAPFVAESPLSIAGLEICWMAGDDNHMPE
jgi:hypothetical protein